METAVGQLHLRLNSRCSGKAPSADATSHVTEQGAFADTGLASKDDHATLASKYIGKQLVEYLALLPTIDQLKRGVSVRRQGRLPDCLTRRASNRTDLRLARLRRIAVASRSQTTSQSINNARSLRYSRLS